MRRCRVACFQAYSDFSDYCANCTKAANGFENEAFIKHIASYMHSVPQPSRGANNKTLQQLGYQYVFTSLDHSYFLSMHLLAQSLVDP